MSKGPSKIQNCILGLLRGEVRRQCYSGGSSPLITNELVDELTEAGLLSDGTPRKQRLFVVRRACDSLAGRGLVIGEYVPAEHATRVVSWSAVLEASPVCHAPTEGE